MNSTFTDLMLKLSSMSAEFGSLVDRGRAIECVNLFTADSKLIFSAGSPKPGTIEGLEAIHEFLTARQAQTYVTTRHVATNFRLEWDGGADAKLESLLTVFRSDSSSRQPVVSVVADVREVFTRTAGEAWLIRERLTQPVFVRTVP